MQRRAHLVAVERQRRIDEAHKAAMDKEETGYLDPETGLWVFTALQHLNRGYCCGSGCRHCPYEHMNVPSVKKAREEREQAAKVAKGTKSPIFTGTGDKGMSSLGTGERKSKGETVFQIMGTLDELNAQLGMVRCSVARHTGYTHKDGEAQYAKLVRQLEHVQHLVFDAGSCMSSPATFEADNVSLLEGWIRDLTEYCPNIHGFILPGGSIVTCHLHVARTVCRRAERCAVQLNSEQSVDAAARKFINRLSDFLFAAARLTAYLDGTADVLVRRKAVWED
jgi:cob(I)alamin adenosyltransferase